MEVAIDELIELVKRLERPFYQDFAFWISLIIGVFGAYFSFSAFREARSAKEAARDAGVAVKIQTLTIELTELIQRLDRLDSDITYQDARDFYNEINRKVRRILSPYRNEDDYKSDIDKIKVSLEKLKKNLSMVAPYDTDQNDISVGNTVYSAIESEFSTLSGLLAELCGLMEHKNLEK